MESFRDTVAFVNLDRLVHNVEVIYKKSKKPLMAIIKADAYGHGANEVAKVLEARPEIQMYGLATVKEAIDLRNSGIKKEMLVIGPTRVEDAKIAAQYNISLTAYSERYILDLIKEKLSQPLKLHIKLDTGMNRIGLKSKESLENALKWLKQNPKLDVVGVFTHFGASEEENDTYQKQIDTFKAWINGYDFKYIHADNTAGTMYHHDDFTNLDRLGIGMYGIDPKGIINPQLQPVMSLKTRVMLTKKVPAGQSVGYNFTYQTKQDEYIATLPIGYGDGFIRKNQGRCVFINGNEYEIVGRVCMDQMMVRVDENIHVGDEVEIFGDHLSIVKMAKELETIPYEILCLLNKRIERKYIKNGSYE